MNQERVREQHRLEYTGVPTNGAGKETKRGSGKENMTYCMCNIKQEITKLKKHM